jgi:hypothetical protein
MATSKKETKNVPQKPAAKATGTAVRTVVAGGGAGSLMVAADTVPDYIKQQGTARGSEQVSQDDLVIPRLEILQALSPMCDASSEAYDPSARPGMLVNSVTKQIYGTEVFVVPVFYNKQYLVWRARQQGGGFLGAYPTAQDAEDRIAKEQKRDGLEIMDTPVHLVLLLDPNKGKAEELMLAMPRTKAKVSRAWNSMIRMAGGDRFGRVYRLSTQAEKNDKGSYHNYVVSISGFPSKPVYEQAEKLYKVVFDGTRQTVMHVGDDLQAGSGGTSDNDDI